MKRLSEHSNIVGVKDATQDLVRPLATRLEIGPDFCQLSGEDATIVPYLSQGGHGCISVTCNVAPGPLSKMHKAWQKEIWIRFVKLMIGYCLFMMRCFVKQAQGQ